MVERILMLMGERGITAKKLTSDLEISNSAVSDWKKGSKPSSDIIVKLATYFDVSTDYILLGVENNNSLTEDDREWLDLIHSLSPETQRDFKGAMRLHADLHDIADREEKLRQAK